MATALDRAGAGRITPRLIRLPEVCRRTGLARSSIYRLLGAGQFPRPVAVTRVARAWRLEEVDRWIDSLGADPLSIAGPENDDAPVGGTTEASHS
ncbi:helix-turn-helix transcriptional regulator [Luteitalea sp.]